MLIRHVLALNAAPIVAALLPSRATARQIAVDYPKTETSPLKLLKGESAAGGGDYYVQLVSEFEFKGGNALKGGCSDAGAHCEDADFLNRLH